MLYVFSLWRLTHNTSFSNDKLHLLQPSPWRRAKAAPDAGARRRPWEHAPREGAETLRIGKRLTPLDQPNNLRDEPHPWATFQVRHDGGPPTQSRKMMIIVIIFIATTLCSNCSSAVGCFSRPSNATASRITAGRTTQPCADCSGRSTSSTTNRSKAVDSSNCSTIQAKLSAFTQPLRRERSHRPWGLIWCLFHSSPRRLSARLRTSEEGWSTDFTMKSLWNDRKNVINRSFSYGKSYFCQKFEDLSSVE